MSSCMSSMSFYCFVAHFHLPNIQDPTAYCVVAHFLVPYIQDPNVQRHVFLCLQLVCVPYIQIRPPIALLFVSCFPVFRIRPPIALLFIFCFPVFRIVTQNPTTLSPPCQTSRPSTFYHNIFWLNILKGLVLKLKHLWLRLPPIWLHSLLIWLRCLCASLIHVWLRMYGWFRNKSNLTNQKWLHKSD
jgi:hypothetical protein